MRLPTLVLTLLAWLLVSTQKCPATDDWLYRKRVQVEAPTRLDWTFAATRRNLTIPPADLIGADYDSTRQTYEFFGPTDASELHQGHPLILYVSQQDDADGWRHWEATCRQQEFLFAGPHKAGAKQPLAKRLRIILDVLDDVRRQHRIDPDRTYLAGWGEGAHLACELGYTLPECFGGIIAINGGETPPVPLWMRSRIAERLSVGFLSVEQGKVATFTEALFHPAAVAIGAESLHMQHYASKAKYPGNELLRKMIRWVDQGVVRRRELAAKYPSTQLSTKGVFSREERAAQVFADAKQRLADKATLFAGLRELEGLQQRWPDLPEAPMAKQLGHEFAAKKERPWEKRSRELRRKADHVARVAFLILHRQLLGIKSDIRIRNRAGKRKNYLEEYVVMHRKPAPAELKDAPLDATRYGKATVDLARQMGGMISFDASGHVKKLSLVGSKVTSKQLRTLKEKLPDLTGLRTLDLSSTLMQDSALRPIAALHGLRALNLNHLEITDRGLSHLAGLKQLQHLGLAFTNVSKLKHLRNLHELRWLILGGSKVNDAALKQLAKATHLRQLSLFSCQITDTGVAQLVAFPHLEFLNLASTKVSNTGCLSLTKILTLQELVLDETAITDKGLTHLTQLVNLRHLSLEKTRITDKGLATLAALTNLETLNVTETQVTPHGVAKFRSTCAKCLVQWSGDPTNFRAGRRFLLAVDAQDENEMEMRRFAMRALQRRLIGPCVRSGEGLDIE